VPLRHSFALLVIAAVSAALASAISELKNSGEDHAFARSFGNAASMARMISVSLFAAFVPTKMLHGWGLSALLALCAAIGVLKVFEKVATEIAKEKDRRTPALARAPSRRAQTARSG